MCHCGNTAVEQTPNKSQHEKKIPLPLLPNLALYPISYPGSILNFVQILSITTPDFAIFSFDLKKKKTIQLSFFLHPCHLATMIPTTFTLNQ